MTTTQDPTHDTAKIEALKRASTAQLLFKAARLTNELAIEHIRVTFDLPKLRAAHTTLFPHIDHEGTRTTEIAARVGVTKQAIAQLVDELVEMGGLERIPDPSDGRAKLIRFAPHILENGLKQLGLVEQGMARILGEDAHGAFHDALLTLVDQLERDPSALVHTVSKEHQNQ